MSEFTVAILDLEQATYCLQFLNKEFPQEKVDREFDEDMKEEYEVFKFYMTMAVNAQLDEVFILAHHEKFYNFLHDAYKRDGLERIISAFGNNKPSKINVVQWSNSNEIVYLINHLLWENNNEH